MSLQFYNTLTRRKEEFLPLEEGKVRMYNCGPTVYGPPSIGNHRAFLFADVLRRYLELEGFEVTQVMNITDVGHLLEDREEGEDKLEAAAKKDGLDPWEIARKYTEIFMKDLEVLGVRPAHHYPRATDHIEEMKEMVAALIEKGYAYEVKGNVYFDVTRFERYGRLSNNKIEDLVAGARVEVHPDKRNAADFALWKSDDRHLMKWDSPWSPHGFPGWHIECSAMSRKFLGDTFDIHTGGEDNIFPHHECEIAQSESFSDQPFVRYWMHTKFLQVDGGKMSKSLGNVYTVTDVVDRGFEGRELRFALIRVHYRQPLNFTWAGLADVRAALQRFDNLIRRLQEVDAETGGEDPGAVLEKMRAGFEEGMDDDLNVSLALSAVYEGVKRLNECKLDRAGAQRALEELRAIDSVLGVMRFEPAGEDQLGPEEQELFDERRAARQAKNWARSDELRDALGARGIVVKDSPQGTLWHRK